MEEPTWKDTVICAICALAIAGTSVVGAGYWLNQSTAKAIAAPFKVKIKTPT